MNKLFYGILTFSVVSIGMSIYTLISDVNSWIVTVKGNGHSTTYKLKMVDGRMTIKSVTTVSDFFQVVFHADLMAVLSQGSFRTIDELVHFIRTRDECLRVYVDED